MNFPLRIALRYIFSKRSFHIINLVTIISVIGITVGVAALVCVMSIFNGFRDITKNQIIGFDPHVRVLPGQDLSGQEAEKLKARLSPLDNVASCSSVNTGRAVAVRGTSLQVLNIMAIDETDSYYKSSMTRKLILGAFDVGKSQAGMPYVVFGAAIGDRLRLFPGDTIYLYSPEMIESAISTYQRLSGIKCLVAGIFQTNQDFDMYAFAGSGLGSSLFGERSAGTKSIDIRLKDIDRLDESLGKIRKTLPQGMKIESWKDLNKELYRVMDYERTATFIILSLIILIAVFNVMASLFMTVVEKKRDISVLISLGAKRIQMRRIFILQGSLIGGFGTLSGAALGLFLCWGQIHFKWFRLDNAKFIVDSIPVLIDPLGVTLVCATALVLSWAATIYPSKRAYDADIIEGIRNE